MILAIVTIMRKFDELNIKSLANPKLYNRKKTNKAEKVANAQLTVKNKIINVAGKTRFDVSMSTGDKKNTFLRNCGTIEQIENVNSTNK